MPIIIERLNKDVRDNMAWNDELTLALAIEKLIPSFTNKGYETYGKEEYKKMLGAVDKAYYTKYGTTLLNDFVHTQLKRSGLHAFNDNFVPDLVDKHVKSDKIKHMPSRFVQHVYNSYQRLQKQNH